MSKLSDRSMGRQPPANLADPLSLGATTVPPPADGMADDATPRACARLAWVAAGLHVLSIGPVGPVGADADAAASIPLPAIQVVSPPSNRFDPVEIITEWRESGAWLGPGGGVVVLRSPPGGGYVLITAYAAAGAPATLPDDIALRPVDRVPGAAAPAAEPAEVETEVTLHIARQGDRRFPGRGWAGTRGGGLQVEAFSISPRGRLSDADIEYKAFGPGGRETRWVSDATLCGTKGRGMPLTGFAVRLAPHLRDRFDVIYQGAFVESGTTGPCRNGEACLPAQHDDALEAVNLRVVERGDR